MAFGIGRGEGNGLDMSAVVEEICVETGTHLHGSVGESREREREREAEGFCSQD
jgi:hypothetical protein